MTNPEYNLLDEPFIQYITTTGTEKTGGILDVFRDAKNIYRIIGDSNLQEISITRLLLAILYRSLPVQNMDEWDEMWEDGLDLDLIESYLEEHRDRFYLFHGIHPFYQIANAEYRPLAKGKKRESHENRDLILGLRGYPKANIPRGYLFADQTESGYEIIPYDEGARRLIELQGWRTGNNKPRIIGHDTEKPRASIGWMGQLTTYMLLGRNFEETLILNFIPYPKLSDLASIVDETVDLPIWEREPHTALPEIPDTDESRIPVGPADLYTHQIARITLYSENGYITRSVIGVGDRISANGKVHLDPMGTWYEEKLEVSSSKGKLGNSTPAASSNENKPRRAYKMISTEGWRNVDIILKRNKSVYPPILFEHFNELNEAVHEELDNIQRFVAFNADYSSPHPDTFERSVATELALPEQALRDREGIIADGVILGYEYIKLVGDRYKQFMNEYHISCGARYPESLKPAIVAMETFLTRAGVEYKEWLLDLDETNLDGKVQTFIDKITRIAENLAIEKIKSTPSSVIHRRRDDGEKSPYQVLLSFQTKLYQTKKGNEDVVSD